MQPRLFFIFVCLILIFEYSTCNDIRIIKPINLQSQLQDISEPFSIISIRKYYSLIINNIAPIMGKSAEFLDDSTTLASFSNLSCVLNIPSNGELAPYDKSIVNSIETTSSVCSSFILVERGNMQIDAAHHAYLVLGEEPTLMISPNDLIPLWSIVLKNAMFYENTRFGIWNRTIDQVFTLSPIYFTPYSVEYVLDNQLESERNEIVKELEEEILVDLELFEIVHRIQLAEGRVMGFSSIRVDETFFCNSTLHNSTFVEEYHNALYRIDFYLYIILNLGLVNSSGTISGIQDIDLVFSDGKFRKFNPNFILESIRNVLQRGGFNNYLSYSHPNSSFDMHYFSNLQKSNIRSVSELMIHSYCFSYYNHYASQYYFRDSSLFYLIFNDVIYFLLAFTGIALLLLNITSYSLDFNLFLKKRILLPLMGPPTLILISLCYTVAIRSKLSVATYWILMIIIVFPVPVLIGSYMVTLFRFSYLKNMDLWQKVVFKHPKIQRHLASVKSSVVISLILTLAGFVICAAPVIGASLAVLYSSLSVPQEMFIIMFAAEILYMLILAVIFFTVDLKNNGAKIIRRKGIGYFFFFDDPFYYRIDLLIMMVMMLLIIPIIVGSLNDTLSYFIVRKVFSLIFFMMFYSIIGGTVTIFYWIGKVKRLLFRNKEEEPLVTQLESLLEDETFREIFKSYSKNEFSMENILLYEELERLRKQRKCTLQDLKNLFETFLSATAVHEVNFPSGIKKSYQEIMDSYKDDISDNSEGSNLSKFVSNLANLNLQDQLKHQTKKENSRIEQVFELLRPDLLKNMLDTFSRLETTPEFINWKKMKEIQVCELGEEKSKEENV
ncbi:predicted protein [Naegleria gruberi]|uniref:Predicted protein n=1 Tax=Naegleria gruberi TaxID=5762 RepID=D2W3A7_NAEGR|nr:uncharacterized protein NAEGRDRAFT_75880 [Naegleria gruberi]EFC36456.1 predicted protein [Naegleria gruberi]|eukprot:XP_002669200.1 predicted protein [Naegleria gruberi strain NEG-M]